MWLWFGDKGLAIKVWRQNNQLIFQLCALRNGLNTVCLLVYPEPYFLDGHNIHMAVSLGMAIYPGDGRSLDEFMKKADKAMYCTKGTGHSTCITAVTEIVQKA